LPPTGAAPTVAAEHSSPGYEAWTRSSEANNGKVLVYGMLMDLAPN